MSTSCSGLNDRRLWFLLAELLQHALDALYGDFKSVRIGFRVGLIGRADVGHVLHREELLRGRDCDIGVLLELVHRGRHRHQEFLHDVRMRLEKRPRGDERRVGIVAHDVVQVDQHVKAMARHLGGVGILLERAVDLAADRRSHARRRTAELQHVHVLARQPEVSEREIGGRVGRRAVAADGDVLALELLGAGDRGLDHELVGQGVGDAADDDDVGALDGGGDGRRVAVLRHVERAADDGLRQHRAAPDEGRRHVEAEALEDALLHGVVQRRRGHRKAVVGHAHLGERRAGLLRVRGGCQQAENEGDGQLFHRRSSRIIPAAPSCAPD